MSKELGMKAVQADGMYYPPHWRPDFHGGDLDKLHGGHKLRDKAKKIDQGIIEIRIELPFPIWCLGQGSEYISFEKYLKMFRFSQCCSLGSDKNR